MLDKKIFNSWFTFLENQYSQKDQLTKALYFEMLGDINTDDFKVGVKKLLIQRTYKSFPTVAELRNACLVDAESRAIMAWGVLYDAIGRYGAYNTVSFDDKIIHMALKSIGGWYELCTSSNYQIKFLKKDFINAYIVHSNTPTETAPYFTGINGDSRVNHIKCDYLSESESNKQLAYVVTKNAALRQITTDKEKNIT